MRTLVLRNRYVLISRIALIALVAGTAAGCSSAFTRFDNSLYSSATEPAPAQQYGSTQPYPGDIDPNATASIGNSGSGPIPVAEISPYGSTSDHAGYDPASGVYQQPGYQAQPAYTPPPAYQPPRRSASAIQRGELVSPIANAPQYNKPPLLAPQTAGRNQYVDPVKTASVKTARQFDQSANGETGNAAARLARQPEKPAQAITAKPAQLNSGKERGWTAAGGTSITMRDGETLYNLSKRYGVPVSAILAANGIKDAGSVKAGQTVVIPTYVYSRSAPVSAPDNDPSTLKASSARGDLAASRQPYESAAVETQGQSGERIDPRREPKRRAQPPASENSVPDYSVTTGSVKLRETVTVASGDSLAKIAKANATNVADLKAANALTSDKLRIGQVLRLPKAGQKLAQADIGVDPIVTGSTKTPANGSGPMPYVKPKTGPSQKSAAANLSAPDGSGIDEFRWPVRGRVISNFGEKAGDGRNQGIDISVPEGTAVKAAENGVVVYAGNELEGLGNLVLVRHANGWVSAYAHNKVIDVKRGEEVRRGQTLARSGRTGSADMPKLHFELRRNSAPVDPLKHLGGA